jgi:hypothetical protein
MAFGLNSVKLHMQSNPFLKNIAQDLLHRFQNDLSGTVIVFPNKRAGLFFRQYLNSLIEKPIWAPQITDISGFIQQYSHKHKADKHALIFRLYRCYRKILKQHGYEAEALDNFYPWGAMLLKDFEETDKNLVKANDLFRSIRELKNIDNYYDYLTEEQIAALRSFWENIDISRSSSHKSKFLRTWEILYEVYQAFTKDLQADHMAYEGMLYREICQDQKIKELTSAYRKIVFAGFNVLNKSEEYLFAKLKKEQKALFYWDIDPYYLEKINFPIAQHLGQMLADFPLPQGYHNESAIRNSTKNIEIIGISQETAQAKVAGNILQELPQADRFDSTAVVLASEHLLFPLLHSIPEDIPNLNVTMGHPMRATQVSTFLDLSLSLQKHMKQSGKHCLFYHKDVVRLLRHPYILKLDEKSIQAKLDEIIRLNTVYISHLELQKLFKHAALLFRHHQEAEQAFDYFQELVEFCYHQSDSNIDKEFIYAFYKEIKSIGNSIRDLSIDLDQKLLFGLVQEVIRSTKLAFEGEPLKGIQIMGSLETVALISPTS